MKRAIFAAVVGLSLLAPSARAQTTFRIATLAPEGTSWMKTSREWATAVENRTGGRVKIKFFAGGVQGDERETVGKMRGGLLNGAGVTGVGLGMIAPEVRVLELPFLLRSEAELDYVRAALADELARKFTEKGYELLSWSDVGWVYIYSNRPITSLADLRSTKIWLWSDDPIGREFLKSLRVTGIPLGVPDVQPALQTGMIDTCYGSPLAVLALQWHSKVKYMTSVPISFGGAAIVLKKADVDKLSATDRAVVIEEGKRMQTRLIEIVRRDNDRALVRMKQLGLQVTTTPAGTVEELRKSGLSVWDELAGKLYSKAWLERVKGLLDGYRKTHST